MKKKLKIFVFCTICLLFITFDTGRVFAGTPDNDNLIFIGTEPSKNGYYNHYIDASQSEFLSDDEALVYVYEASNGNLKSGALKKYQINFSNNTITRLSITGFIDGQYVGESPNKFAQRPLDQIPFYEQVHSYFTNSRSTTNTPDNSSVNAPSQTQSSSSSQGGENANKLIFGTQANSITQGMSYTLANKSIKKLTFTNLESKIASGAYLLIYVKDSNPMYIKFDHNRVHFGTVSEGEYHIYGNTEDLNFQYTSNPVSEIQYSGPIIFTGMPEIGTDCYDLTFPTPEGSFSQPGAAMSVKLTGRIETHGIKGIVEWE